MYFGTTFTRLKTKQERSKNIIIIAMNCNKFIFFLQMSAAVSTFGYKLPYDTIFGGVSSLTKEQMRIVNGFSNIYFGWGGEDDDFRARYIL